MIIGISGKIGHGKDSLASAIQSLGYVNWENKKFAFKLKQIVSILTGIPTSDLEKEEVKSSILPPEWNKNGFPITYRQVLQWVGTEAMRDKIHTNVWVNALFADYTPQSNWIVSDCRFPNEAKAIKDRGGVVIRVVRPSVISTSTHPSETSLDDYDFDHTIINDGSLESLVAKVVCLDLTL